ncbi:uncharacterized protein B0I36DRAFT_364426 [Microdochium trichocladiopsis]|uniref:Uncharacterized protein n=1 Tax=Microdochium trichocladiopsis TaxID=1682393 RepID=A0A9P8Y1I7_9PEZI|nr:uncharacterized protein B0I36DRAFT_364426 [Microdochium trichocladiopsis]KAH7027184.1 hypothetical protein B0I36DRAFT_364426 [Microdochium trichocladiopsis]
MQLINILTVALLPLSVLALPSAVEAVAARDVEEYAVPIPVDEIEADGIEERDNNPKKIFARAQNCRVTGSGTVNCRACADTACQVTHYVYGGSLYNWRCAITGERVVIGGVGDSVWYREYSTGCFTSGHYLPSSCRPGSCEES